MSTTTATAAAEIPPKTVTDDDSNRDGEGEVLQPVPADEAEQDAQDDRTRKMGKSQQLMSKRTMNWTSTKTPATSVGEALHNAVSSSDAVCKGIRVSKITSRGRFKHRILTLSSDKFAIFVTHNSLSGGRGVISTVANKIPIPMLTRKGFIGFNSPEQLRDMYVRYIDVADMDAIQVGLVGTPRLEAAREKNRLKGYDSKVDKSKEEIVTIVHHGNQTLDVLVPNVEERDELVDCLRTMREVYNEAQKNVADEALLLRYIWYDVDLNRDGKIGESEFRKILSRINLFLKNPGKVYREFVKGTGKKDGLDYSDVTTLLQQLKNKGTKSMANQLWDGIFGKDVDVVSTQEFLTKFLHEIQGETHANLVDVQTLFTTLNKMEMNHSEGEPADIVVDQQLSRARFEVYLSDNINDAYDPFSQDKDDKSTLDKPISYYWINTSHNTYLSGDQIRSTSSVDMYMRALRRGCKCVELDCWDGEKTSGGKCIPVVFHGHTLTTKIAFEDIISGIKNYMDENKTTYPIIMSLENHCSPPYQEEMAKMMKLTLGEYLYLPSEDDTSGPLPSPEALRGKVVIKGKRPPDPDEGTVSDAATDAEEGDDVDPYAEKEGDGKSDKKHAKIVPELASMTLFHGTKFKEFETSLTVPNSHMHSIGETKISKILSKKPENAELWRKYNVEHMTRTYPAGTRVDSSNYNPLTAWSVGSQLVALNFANSPAGNSPLMLNDGLFRQGRECGYIIKPPSILGEVAKEPAPVAVEKKIEEPAAPDYEPDTLDMVMESAESVICGTNALPRDASHSYTYTRSSSAAVKERMLEDEAPQADPGLPVQLKIRILSGSCLPKPKGAKTGETIDPYVTVTLHDMKIGESGKPTHVTSTHSTSVVNDNGFCPIWNEKKYKAFTVTTPAVAMLQFALKESDSLRVINTEVGIDEKVGGAAIPLSCLRTGYRSIQLYDHNNTRSGPFSFATLLVDIQFAYM